MPSSIFLNDLGTATVSAGTARAAGAVAASAGDAPDGGENGVWEDAEATPRRKVKANTAGLADMVTSVSSSS
jgi:hypothetical protein